MNNKFITLSNLQQYDGLMKTYVEEHGGASAVNIEADTSVDVLGEGIFKNPGEHDISFGNIQGTENVYTACPFYLTVVDVTPDGVTGPIYVWSADIDGSPGRATKYVKGFTAVTQNQQSEQVVVCEYQIMNEIGLSVVALENDSSISDLSSGFYSNPDGHKINFGSVGENEDYEVVVDTVTVIEAFDNMKTWQAHVYGTNSETFVAGISETDNSNNIFCEYEIMNAPRYVLASTDVDGIDGLYKVRKDNENPVLIDFGIDNNNNSVKLACESILVSNYSNGVIWLAQVANNSTQEIDVYSGVSYRDNQQTLHCSYTVLNNSGGGGTPADPIDCYNLACESYPVPYEPWEHEGSVEYYPSGTISPLSSSATPHYQGATHELLNNPCISDYNDLRAECGYNTLKESDRSQTSWYRFMPSFLQNHPDNISCIIITAPDSTAPIIRH